MAARICWTTAFLMSGFGCATSKRPPLEAPVALPPPVLAPAVTYPEERTDWDSRAILMFRPQVGLNGWIQEQISAALVKRGYTVVAAPANELEWLSADHRQRSKMISVLTSLASVSRAYEGKSTAEVCVQIEVVDRPYGGGDFAASRRTTRLFAVWGRADVSPLSEQVSGALDSAGYAALMPATVDNLMRMPGFRHALEPGASKRVALP